MRRGGDCQPRPRQCRVLVAVLPITLLMALVGPPGAASAAPYEPNDAMPAAFGPLALGQGYSAALESSGDRDYFYFYVTSPAAAQVELAVRNLGGGGEPSDLDVAVFNSSATPVAGQAFIRDGETRTLAISLEPQKYFVEVSSGEGFGDSYSLAAGGAAGAFGSYAQISGRCSRATAATTTDRAGLSRAKLKLQRATARLRRSRYATRTARRKAQANRQTAKRRVDVKRHALRKARGSTQPWCSITP
ncbi:MAG: hypothetical protein ACRDLL_01105 [Solirubrobacterales bacterium]